MKKTLKNTLITSYSAIAVLTVLCLSLFFNVMADRMFETYAKKQQKNQVDQIIFQINQLYNSETGLYDINGIEIIGYAALQNGIIIHMQSANRDIDWDVRSHRAEECKMVLQHAESNMHKTYPNFKGSYTEESYQLENDGKITGTLKIGYYGPYSLNDEELELLKALNKSLLLIGAISLVAVIIFGVLIARNVSKPITGVIQMAQRIAGGEYGVQSDKKIAMVETSNLVESINKMSLALKEDERQKRQITADVAHELRTPLTNLQSHLEAMLDGIWPADYEHLESCHGEILRLVEIVEQLQELYYLENRKQALNKTNFEFHDLCVTVFRDFEIKRQDKNISLRMAMPAETPVHADYYRLKQCMVNLLSNALTYTPAGGDIIVEFQTIANKIIIKVKDSGPGIPAADLPYLFDRFYRVDKSRSKKNGGMGIGLSVTRAIVEKHGGEIYAESDYGQGTVFTMVLPINPNIR
ncbi:sensor histidine kinase [Lacrimispora sp.]|uniref:sensor histidine kinase n=1 Tax=Lacrimispora sp. TaxID=2719234 RepID=UPI0028A078A7|nr:HAMP domain-containing sensor histidine kinase [Lacrimispora sp.]